MTKLFNKRFYIVIAAVTFFLVITAQVFWAAIHGDGAVYAWIIRKITENGVFHSVPPYWTQSQIFAEHPYLFFYFSAIFTKIFGFSDVAVKLPNFVIAGCSLWLIYKVTCYRDANQPRSYQLGLAACYALLLNSVYTLQVSQPTLDPLAHLLSLGAVLILIYKRNSFLAGILLGLAFLTKGLELLPHLAAIFALVCYMNIKNINFLIKSLLLGLLGLSIPILIWLGYDYFVWQSQWRIYYWSRQFVNRLFHASNMQTTFGINYVLTFIKSYLLEIGIISFGVLKVRKKWVQQDPLFFYFIVYVFFNILAFSLIKKDSSQHMTGVLLFGSIFVGELVWSFFNKFSRFILHASPVFFFFLAAFYFSWFVGNRNANFDLWTAIKNEAINQKMLDSNVPIVIRASASNDYGIFYTTQWYFPNNKVYLLEDAEHLLEGQGVFVIGDSAQGELVKTKTVFQRGVL